MQIEVAKRFEALVLGFRVKNALTLGNGKCACVLCRKMFRSTEYLDLHFDRAHPQELRELQNRAEQDIASRMRKLQGDHSDS
jgi:hypothetical protein